jgi:hypothetical protein
MPTSEKLQGSARQNWHNANLTQPISNGRVRAIREQSAYGGGEGLSASCTWGPSGREEYLAGMDRHLQSTRGTLSHALKTMIKDALDLFWFAGAAQYEVLDFTTHWSIHENLPELQDA